MVWKLSVVRWLVVLGLMFGISCGEWCVSCM